MIRVLLATADDSLAARLTEAIGNAFVRVDSHPLPGAVDGYLTWKPGEPVPDIVLLDGTDQEDAALALASRLNHMGVATILVSPRAAELALPAMRAGVRDVLVPEAAPTDLRGALDRTAAGLPAARAQVAAPAASTPGKAVAGRLVAVVSPKGGVGKTTVATNLAVGLAGKRPGSVVLVDLDIHFGDVASALNLEPEHTLPDIARGPASKDSIALKSYLAAHETGLFVVPGSDSPAAADAVTAEDAGRLLRSLKEQFTFVVVDTAPGLSEHTLAVLDEADTLVMVTSLDVPGVRGLRKEIDTLSELQLMSGQRHVVLNFNEASRGLSIADVEATIRTRVDVVIPQSNQIPLSVNQGIPLLQSNGRDPVTRQLRTLLDLVDPPEDTAKRGLFGRRAR